MFPNVCRIFDLVVEDGQELVSMEVVDGSTLAETLARSGPAVAGRSAGDRLAVSLGAERAVPRSELR